MMWWILLGAIAFLLLLIVIKVHPALALLITSITAGLAYGMPYATVLKAVQQGVADTMGAIALVIVLGAILGKWMERTGAANAIANTLIKRFGKQHIQWAVLVTSFVVGIPLFYNAGFVVLVPLVFALAAESGLSLVFLALPMAAALSVTHGLLPPHPSPVALASIFNASIGKTLAFGLLISAPAAALAGPLLGRRFRYLHSAPSPILFNTTTPPAPGLPRAYCFLMALLPVGLILLMVALSSFWPGLSIGGLVPFLGEPIIAFLISLVVVAALLVQKANYTLATLMQWTEEAMSGIAVILLIIAAGGAFKQVLIGSGLGDEISRLAVQWQLSPLFMGWLIAALLRVTLGSATVAGLSAAGMVAPLVAAGDVSPELMVIAVGSGSLFFSHVNDTGFWMFKSYLGLTVKQTFMSWTLMESIVSIMGLLGALFIQYFFT